MTLTADRPISPGVAVPAVPAGAGADRGDVHRRLGVPALHPAWIVVAMVAAGLLRAALGAGVTNDAWWHWAAGQWMLDHHTVIRHDVFSYSVPGRPWVAEEWGFEVLLAGLVRLLGGAGFWVVSAGACVAALFVSVGQWRRNGAGMMRVAGLAAVAGAYLRYGQSPRPQAASYLCFAVLLLLQTLARRRTAWLAALPVLFCVWANLHGSFLAGLAVLALDAGLSFAPATVGRLRVSSPLPRRAASRTLLACILATFVNPHGPGLLGYAWHVAFNPQLAAHISEWAPPPFGSPAVLLLVMAPAALVGAALVLTDAPVEAFDLVVWGGLLLASLHSERFLPYTGLAWCALAARTVVRADRFHPTRLTWPLAAVLAGVLVVGHHPPAGAPARGGGDGEPVAAVQWLASHPGRVLAEYSWDDYLIAQGRKVFVDGRTDLYFGTGVLDTYWKVSGLAVDPDPVLGRWDVRYVLWPPSTPLAVFLSHDPAWRVAYRAGNSLVFARRVPT